ncbi:DUF3413 domain-containing protein [Shewanella acanthi]|uniref:DUF3413 domain-containing protein n=1 Tax=Shewanella acanthi TaxID=2864212 RepID=UPI001C6553A9|nr:DUF3413 domain-containing protein [Shewanella acanthi]QYJ78778.1 DUF3413 domain-containing protein [Shewanella acanthi]
MFTSSTKPKASNWEWFILFNAFLATLLSTRYFAFLPEFPSDFLGQFFIIISSISQMFVLTGLFAALIVPLHFLPKYCRNIALSGAAAVGLTALFIDTLVFAQYRFHINSVVLNLVLSGQVVSFPLITWLMVTIAILGLWITLWLLLKWIQTATLLPSRVAYRFAYLALSAFVLTHIIHIWAAANAYQPVTQIKRYLPLFYPATANRFMEKHGWVDQQAIAQQKSLSLHKSDLHYPIHPLQVQPVEKPTNIMLIVIDSWRFDTFSADNTPNLWNLTQTGVRFNQHMASGNATRTGIFGLFYGIPGTYWQGVLANNQGPVLIDRLQQLDYQLGIFTAAQLRNPEFDRTVFTNVKDLRIGSEGSSASELDANLTHDWLTWYDKRDPQKPAFSFLFYDSAHGYDFPKDYPHQYQPMLSDVNYLQLNNNTDPLPFFNRYRTSVHYVDSLIAPVVDKLKETGDLANTLIIITGDHGQEMNDNKLNFWGHNSNYTPAQVHVPFAVVGPQINANASLDTEQLTSHQDLVPTLMQGYLGVTNPIGDYSVGLNLLNPMQERAWILASNYSSYAMLTSDTILEVGSAGQYELLDKTNRPLKGKPNFDFLQQVLEQLSHFSK